MTVVLSSEVGFVFMNCLFLAVVFTPVEDPSGATPRQKTLTPVLTSPAVF